jgi:hypothetical protein
MGPPQLQCQQFAVQAWVTSNDTESGRRRSVFHAPWATIRTAIVRLMFISRPDRRERFGAAGGFRRSPGLQ